MVKYRASIFSCELSEIGRIAGPGLLRKGCRWCRGRSTLKFLQSNLRNYRVAILGPRGLVQNFTQDRTQLLWALDQVSESLPNPAATPLMSAGYDLLQ